MYPSTPPAVDLSRSRLKALAKWVRDDLDVLVAREGPDVLRPDDVLTLHEIFIALRQSSNITALDLRATGIHRAVQDVAGVATRWPGRLCDDCDKIIALWQAKFGPFNQLRPFLYGRGGRLEGIASVTEYSRERWSEACPEKLHPKRSHRLGALGFRAGDWWINTLFAHHAGIIGLEAVEGGTTFDKYGAYALVLKDTGEVEASGEANLTYRVPNSDKGKFRLTSATPRSRDPIRVLRSHSINSVWGPKAGVRYEGLYAVKGWSIRQAKTTDIAGGEWKQGDIIFEVRFERQDSVPMNEVTKRPTAAEVDDYSEYKRLRKVHREGKRKGRLGATASSINVDLTLAKAAPPIPPPQPSGASGGTMKVRRSSPSRGSSRKSMFRRPHFDMPEAHPQPTPDVVSPMTIPDTDQFPLPRSTLTVPGSTNLRPHLQGGNDSSPSGSQQTRPANPLAGSDAISAHTAASTQSDIQEVAPWIDYDAGLTLPSHGGGHSIIREQIISQAGDPQPKALISRTASNMAQDGPPISTRRDRRKSGDLKGMTGYGYLNPVGSSRMKDGRKSIFVRSRNPMAKLFDGAPSPEDVEEYFGNAVYKEADTKQQTSPPLRNRLPSLSDSAIHVRSLPPNRSFTPSPPHKLARRGAIFAGSAQKDPAHAGPRHPRFSPVKFPLMQTTCNHSQSSPTRPGLNSIHTLSLPRYDPFVDSGPLTPRFAASAAAALPMSLRNLMVRSESGTSTSRKSETSGEEDADAKSERKERADGSGDAKRSPDGTEKEVQELDPQSDRGSKGNYVPAEEGVNVKFTNPFAYAARSWDSPGIRRRMRMGKARESSGIAPEDVILTQQY
ncbi:hypothetical protein BKA63DRAFT_582788 [Paraphoma chrysanthemicola]|nr:hypothetical protein BKA63DRAFT_582788 [Paraphoma chrysanthemicola]